MRLRAKTITLFAVSGALILAVMGTVQFFSLKSRTFSNIEYQVTKQLEHLDFALTRFVNDVENDLLILSADARVRTPFDDKFTNFLSADEDKFQYNITPTEQSIIDLFSTFRHYHPHVNSVYMGRENGSFVRSHPRQRPTRYDPRTRPWYELAKAYPGKVMRTPPYRSLTTPDVNIAVVTPLLDAYGRFFGVVGADITLAGLTEYLKDFTISYDGEVIVLDNQGIVLAAIDEELLFKDIRSIFDEYLSLENSDKTEHQVLTKSNQVLHGYIHSSQGTDWTILALLDDRKIRADLREIVESNMQFIAMAIVFLSIVTLAGLYRYILSPVNALTGGARHIRNTGDLDYRFQLKSKDELQELGRAFNELLKAVKSAETKLRSSKEALQQERNLLDERVKVRTAELEELNKNLVREVAEREQAQKEADQANQAKSLFLANMSHEIRTPLNAILGFTQILVRDPEISTANRRSLETVYRSGEHLLMLLNDILEMSKIEAGRTTLSVENFDLHDLLKDIESMFQVLTRDKNILLKVSTDPDLPHWVKGDEQKLHQILNNLVSNAVKFTDQGQVIVRGGLVAENNRDAETKASEQPVHIYFEVEDTGSGIPEKDLKKVFSHFEQPTPGSHMKGGTGLGLAIARAFAELMQGSITVQSQVGKGSIFRLEVILNRGSSEKSQVRRNIGPLARLSSRERELQVLVVDDNEANREILIMMLEQAGFMVKQAVNGVEACKVYDQWKPDLILLDMIMPEMDGFGVLDYIRKKDGENAPPVIAVTASVLLAEKKRVLSAGASAFLKKPFKASELFGLIKEHLKVEFEDEDSHLEDNQDLPDSTNLKKDLAHLYQKDPEVISSLKEAAFSLDEDGLREIISKISAQLPNLTRVLLGLVDNYQYQELQQILQEDSDE